MELSVLNSIYVNKQFCSRIAKQRFPMCSHPSQTSGQFDEMLLFLLSL